MTKEIMDKAGKALASARLLLEAGDGDGATNRAYYAMSDAASAALVWAEVVTALDRHKTHSGLIANFGLHLVRTGRLAAEFGRSLNRVQELRLTGDYLAEALPLEKAEWAVQEAETFVSGVRQLLTTRPAPTKTGDAPDR
jgi:uncharacterized protein (UPF0332 family)